MPSPEPVLRARAIARRFGYRPVLRDVSLELYAGDALVLVGANGAGKTTLLKVLAGLLRPSAGDVVCRAPIGAVMHDAMLYPALTARENLRFFARLRAVRDAGRIDTLLAAVDLVRRADDRVHTYSRGMVQRLAIARALLHGPGLLLLDEPLSGIDEAGSRGVVELLGRLRADGVAMILVTHQPEKVRAVGSQLGRLAGGTLQPPQPFGVAA